MDRSHFCQIAARLMRCPAAPRHEAMVRAAAEQICAEHDLPHLRDKYGNLLVHMQTDRTCRPLVLAAHMDHPGFEILRALTPNCWLARFLGGVPDSYFHPGIPVRLMTNGLAAVLGPRAGKNKEFELHLNSGRSSSRQAARSCRTSKIRAVTHSIRIRPAFAVWELEDFALRRDQIHGRSCDDLIGVAAILATLIELRKAKARVNVMGVISRAEEIGFHGALTVAASRRLPKNSLVISLETSRELPAVQMGRGVIIRVGDRTSVFDPAGTRFLTEVAGLWAGKDRHFQFQRALMSGGTCEATAYQEFGYQAAAVCIALGNYHNCGEGGQIAPEFVSISDACGMVDLLVEAARQMRSYSRLVCKLTARMAALSKKAHQGLSE
jgi:putative aminopeptidase FrvX